MVIRIYGPGCGKCRALAERVQGILDSSGIEASVEKVSELGQIVNRGVLMTPALEIDGRIVSSGRLPEVSELVRLIPGSHLPEEGLGTPKRARWKALLAVALLLLAAAGVAVPVLRECPSEQPPDAAQATCPEGAVGVYWFHRTRRCPTCNRIEAAVRQTLGDAFPEEVAKGRVVFRSVNLDAPENRPFVDRFQLTSGTLVIQRGDRFERMDEVWRLVRDEPALASRLCTRLRTFLTPGLP
ncbi:MAG: nitrophenyl compound nitroreductase subunit ArsF family protein [Kiritimatiellia bacterium]